MMKALRPGTVLTRTLMALFIAFDVLFLIGPMIVTIAVSFTSNAALSFPPHGFSLRWYRAVLANSQWTSAAYSSLKLSLLVTVVALIVGVPATYALVRSPRMRGRSVVLALVMAPLVTPAILLAIGLAVILIDRGLTATVVGLVFAQTVLAVPFVVLNAGISLRAVDPNLEPAAWSLGASPARTLRYVTLPLMKRGLIASAIFAFLAAWDDATVVIFITGPHLTTLPIYLLTQVQDDLNPEVAAVAGLLCVGVLLALGITIVVAGIGPFLGRNQSSLSAEKTEAVDTARSLLEAGS